MSNVAIEVENFFIISIEVNIDGIGMISTQNLNYDYDCNYATVGAQAISSFFIRRIGTKHPLVNQIY